MKNNQPVEEAIMNLLFISAQYQINGINFNQCILKSK